MTTARRKPTRATAEQPAAKAASRKAAAKPAAKAAPRKAAAKPAARRTVTSDTLPSDTLPSDTLPSDTLPSDTLPSDTLPSDALVLTGPPGLLRTTVSVENAVDQRVAVRGLTLHRAGREALTGTGAAVIAPGATADVPVAFRLEPDTPPGDYPAEVEVGGLRRAAVLRVEQDLSLRVSPRRMLADVGDSTVTVTVANDGNVPIPLAAVVRARTDDGGPDPGPDVTLTLTGATTVVPGATTVLTGRLAVPEELDPTRRHTARIPVGPADLDVIILPRDASENLP